MAKDKIIGIDLGTTNSVVAVMEGGKPVVIHNLDGARLTPSVVGFAEDGERLVGVKAKRQAVTNPQNTVFSIKRFMGRRHKEVSAEEKMVPYQIVGAADELVKVRVRDKDYTPPEISAMILQSLRSAAKDYLGEDVDRAVITVPAYFNDSQRQATKEAGTIAGLKVERIINEPTAAALAYGLEKTKDEKIAVFDFGGGTFDISILEVGEGVFEVKATNGDTHLGGDDLDEVLIGYIADEFRKQQGIDLRKDQMALQRLKEAAEAAKCDLSTSAETDVNLPFITADASGPKHLHMTINRAKLEELCRPVFDKLKSPCFKCLEDARLRPEEIDEVILVGGSTRIPRVQEIVKDIFHKEPHKGVNPDEVVAVGAAIQGGVLGGEVEDVVLVDVTPLSLGIPPAPRGMPQIEVSFDLDADGILNVKASDLGTGKEQQIVIKSSSGLTEAEVEEMRKQAELHADEDRKRRELVEARNLADQLIYQTEKTLKEHGGKLGADDRRRVDEALESLRKAKDSEDKEEIQSKMEALQTASHRLAEVIYQQSRAQQESGARAGATGAAETEHEGPDDEGEDVVDADFEVKE